VRIFDKYCLKEVIDVIRKNIITLNILEGMIKNNEKTKSRAYIEDFIGITMHELILLSRD
jgi:hypothetical protein